MRKFKKKDKTKQIKSLDEVIEYITNGTVVYCKTTEKRASKTDEWHYKYGIALLPSGKYVVVKESWYSTKEWDDYSTNMSMEEILHGTWFIKEKK